MKTICSTVLGSVAALALLGSVALADPVGDYTVVGKGPDGHSYRGTASIEATGETYRVVWLIGKQKFVGTAVGNDDFFAVSYKSGSSTGVAVYGKDGDGWVGVWTYAGGTSVGAEKLTPR
jgi:hypothetical protein